MSKLLRRNACLRHGRVGFATSFTAASRQRRQEFGIEAAGFIAKRVVRRRRSMVAAQFLLESMLHQRLLDVAFYGLFVGKGEVCVASEHGLIVWPICPSVQPVEAMAPPADEDQLLAPGSQCLHQFREGF
ncbi:hypothetical protein SDC9_115405 [bioreactor metagenome]|uniref:Uncharacterized protein n=1 Tax=bioreactor metagenome TaxID=1076179 RepID=A0A645BTB0_9ZZZZ